MSRSTRCPGGEAKYAPAGAGVWSRPAIDAASRTVFHGTGNGFTGASGPGQDDDTVIALNIDTGELRWKQQINHPDVWTVGCIRPIEHQLPVEHCAGMADGTNIDWDFGSSPNMSAVTATPGLVYEGSMDGKMRIYRAEDGEIVWQYDTVREFTGGQPRDRARRRDRRPRRRGRRPRHALRPVGVFPWFGMTGRVLLAFGLWTEPLPAPRR